MANLLPATWDVPEVFRQRLGAQAGRQRTMVADGHLLLVLHAPPKPGEAARVGRFFWRSPDGKWTSKDLGTGINALKTHLDEYDDVLSRLDRLEEVASTSEDSFEILEQLTPLHRATRNLHNVLQEARKAYPEYRELINLRDRAYEIERTAELLFNETKNELDYTIARRVEEQAQASQRMAVSAHRLNILAAFFFPIAALTAIFGVNLEHGWESDSAPFPFLVTIALGLLLGCILTVFVTRPGNDTNA
jgi:Mg2+ and Co2+ transporter CorA